jgi:hypothetical protein
MLRRRQACLLPNTFVGMESEVLVPVTPRRVGLFEGLDGYGRLQPLLGGRKT